MDYIELNLLEMLDTYGEDRLQPILSVCVPKIQMWKTLYNQKRLPLPDSDLQ